MVCGWLFWQFLQSFTKFQEKSTALFRECEEYAKIVCFLIRHIPQITKIKLMLEHFSLPMKKILFSVSRGVMFGTCEKIMRVCQKKKRTSHKNVRSPSKHIRIKVYICSLDWCILGAIFVVKGKFYFFLTWNFPWIREIAIIIKYWCLVSRICKRKVISKCCTHKTPFRDKV